MATGLRLLWFLLALVAAAVALTRYISLVQLSSGVGPTSDLGFLPPVTVSEESSQNESLLPEWITDYFAWHRAMREQFPGKDLFEHAEAPKILVRACPFKCGGLHDRLGQLPWDLYFANQTNRILLFKWHFPLNLERFLVPAGSIDWRVPEDVDAFDNLDQVWKLPRMMPNIHAKDEEVMRGLADAINGTLSTEKVLVYTFLGHIKEALLEELLRSMGESDDVHRTPTFGTIFRSFFKPSNQVEAAIREAKKEVGLQSLDYTGVHCRVRHPKNFPKDRRITGKGGKGPADRVGLEFKGWGRDYAVSVATHAIRCGMTLLHNASEPIYFFSDESQLVNYFVRTLKRKNSTTEVDRQAQRVLKQTNVVARKQRHPNVHLDRQKGEELDAYISVFVDLFLAIGARCLSFGVGNFGYFATKISGTSCRVKHRENEWGTKSNGFDKLCTRGDFQDK